MSDSQTQHSSLTAVKLLEDRIQILIQKTIPRINQDLLEKGKATTPVFWPGEFHGLYSPWGHKESDTIEQLALSGQQNKKEKRTTY